MMSGAGGAGGAGGAAAGVRRDGWRTIEASSALKVTRPIRN